MERFRQKAGRRFPPFVSRGPKVRSHFSSFLELRDLQNSCCNTVRSARGHWETLLLLANTTVLGLVSPSADEHWRSRVFQRRLTATINRKFPLESPNMSAAVTYMLFENDAAQTAYSDPSRLTIRVCRGQKIWRPHLNVPIDPDEPTSCRKSR